jgi:hypothetical protein
VKGKRLAVDKKDGFSVSDERGKELTSPTEQGVAEDVATDETSESSDEGPLDTKTKVALLVTAIVTLMILITPFL